jgi:hypothetical protein
LPLLVSSQLPQSTTLAPNHSHDILWPDSSRSAEHVQRELHRWAEQHRNGGDRCFSSNRPSCPHSAPLSCSHSPPLFSYLIHSSTQLRAVRSAPLNSTLLHTAPLCSTLLHTVPLSSTPLHSAPFYSTLLHSTPLSSTPLHSAPRCSHTAPLCSTKPTTCVVHSSYSSLLTLSSHNSLPIQASGTCRYSQTRTSPTPGRLSPEADSTLRNQTLTRYEIASSFTLPTALVNTLPFCCSMEKNGGK